LGTFLPSYRPGLKVRESSHKKFYFFDPGVARASAGLLGESMDSISEGFALETLILNELRIYKEIHGKHSKIFFYNVPGSDDIDFVIETRKKTIQSPGSFISIEVKASQRWRSEFEVSSRTLQARSGKSCERILGVYLGHERLKFKDFDVLPLSEFISDLYNHKII
jgi:predicted AAA+ superfamily ATPase